MHVPNGTCIGGFCIGAMPRSVEKF
jgi:hypothetical protein